MKAYLFRKSEEPVAGEQALEYLYVPGVCLIRYSVKGKTRVLQYVDHVTHKDNGSLRSAQEFVDTGQGQIERFKGYSIERAEVSKKRVNRVIDSYVSVEKALSNFRLEADPLVNWAIVDSIDQKVSVTLDLSHHKSLRDVGDHYARIVDYLMRHQFTNQTEPDRFRYNYYDLRLGKGPLDDGPIVGIFDQRALTFKAFKGTRLEKILRRLSTRSPEGRGGGSRRF